MVPLRMPPGDSVRPFGRPEAENVLWVPVGSKPSPPADGTPCKIVNVLPFVLSALFGVTETEPQLIARSYATLFEPEQVPSVYVTTIGNVPVSVGVPPIAPLPKL